MGRPIAFLLLLGVATAWSDGAPLRAAPAAPCVTARAEARYRNYGYDHLVHLRSRCPGAMVCQVSSDVQPKPRRVRLARGASTTVVLMVGSPARAFVPRVTCEAAR